MGASVPARVVITVGGWLLAVLPCSAQAEHDYVADVEFAIDAVEKQCATLLKSKDIDWRKVTAPLLDEATRSAGETAAGLFKDDGRGYVIGESSTAGMSSQKTTIELPSKLFALYVSTGSNMGRYNGGKGLEGIGVIPHRIVEFDPYDLYERVDTLIRVAEELLAKFPQKDVHYDPKSFGWKP